MTFEDGGGIKLFEASDVPRAKRGLFSIRVTGDSAAIQNARDFVPRAW